MTTIAEIQRAVAEHFGVRISDILSDRTAAKEARPRQVAMYLSAKLTKQSLPAIGLMFKREHSTISHGVRNIEILRRVDRNIDHAVRQIIDVLMVSDPETSDRARPVDWSAARPPWNELGPEIAANLRAIALA